MTEPVDELTGSPGSRRVLSVVFAVWLFAIGMWNFPDYSVRVPWQAHTKFAYDPLYLSFEWDYFAPNARANTGLPWGEIHYVDGTVDRFDAPDAWGPIESFRSGRWSSAMSRIANREEWTQSFAEWLATTGDPARTVDHVEVWADMYWTPHSNYGPVERDRETRQLFPFPENAPDA